MMFSQDDTVNTFGTNIESVRMDDRTRGLGTRICSSPPFLQPQRLRQVGFLFIDAELIRQRDGDDERLAHPMLTGKFFDLP